jgi:murein DD-endopeptidase MepM/ murein hydrolase activator NlpD
VPVELVGRLLPIDRSAPPKPEPEPEPAKTFSEADFEKIQYIPSPLQNMSEDDIDLISRAEVKEAERVVEATPPEMPRTKTVKAAKGDTIYSLARRHGVKVYDLAADNGIKSPFLLKIGQALTIPDTSAPRPEKVTVSTLSPKKTFIEEPHKPSVTVKKGDTLYSVAKNNNAALKDLIVANGLSAPYALKIGQVLAIPGKAFVIVGEGDTLYSISRRYSVNLKSLADANKIKDGYIALGQRLVLPASVAPASGKKLAVAKDGDKKIVKAAPKPAPPAAQKGAARPAPAPEVADAARKKIESIIARPEPMQKSRFAWPIPGKVISGFGTKSGGMRNDGINISVALGSNITAAENGVVAYAGNELKGLGNLVIIRHDKDFMSVYAHARDLKVKKGDRVSRGQVIASAGKTGRVTSPQLHFEIRQKTRAIDPESVLERR